MANFLINSPGLVTTGTDQGETFLVQSAAVSATTIIGLAGNDTIDLLEGRASAEKVSIAAGGGADLIQLSATDFDSATIIRGGAGGDTITFSAGVNANGQLLAGAGSDLGQIRGAVGLATVGFGAGADKLTANNAISASAARISFGAGADTLQFDGGGQFNDASIFGGGGADVVVVSAGTESSTALTIGGGAGKDTITFELQGADGVAVKGGNGDDVMTQSAAGSEIMESSQVLGGGGKDSMTFIGSGFSATAADANILVGGGAGADTLVFADYAMDNADISVKGGGGADSINMAVNGTGIAITAGTIFGGGGADSITFSGTIASEDFVEGVLGIEEFSDSTLSSTDVVTFTMSAADASGMALTFRTDGLGTNLTAASGFQNGTVTIAASNVATFTSTLTDLTARVEGIDALATSNGSVVAFEDAASSAGYLFIQGGSTDTLIKLNEAGGALSGYSAVAIANSSVTIDFIGM